MVSMSGGDWKIVTGTILFGILAALASVKGCPAEAAWSLPSGTSAPSVEDRKRELLDRAGLGPLHHEIHASAGEVAWEKDIKPAFLRDLALAAARENGTLLPDEQAILDWVDAHPEEARALLRRQKRD
jgi:hypothetical protein